MQVLNRNSRGLAIDLKTEAGKEVVYKLVRNADIFMSNYERNSVKRLGLDYASLSRAQPPTHLRIRQRLRTGGAGQG